MYPCWTKIINATGFSCMTLDIYEIDKYIVGLFQRFLLMEVVLRSLTFDF